MLFANLRLKMFIGVAVLLLIAAVTTFAYIKGSSSRISSLERNQIELQHSNEAQAAVLAAQQQNIETLGRISSGINQRFQDASNSLSFLARRLENQHLRSNATSNPSATELLINQDAIYTARCNEIVTGGALIPEDDQNTICADLINRRKNS